MGCGPTGVGLNRCKCYVSNYLNTFLAGCHKYKLIKPYDAEICFVFFFHSGL